MLYFTKREQQILAVLVVCVAAGAATSMWMRHRDAITISVIPAPAEATIDAAGAPIPRADRVDVNVADTTRLQRLPGIGPVLAQRVVRYRELHGPFRDEHELQQVAGLGASIIERIRPWIVVSTDRDLR